MLRPSRPLLLLALLLAPLSAHAVETMRIAMSESADEVRVAGRALAVGADTEEGPFHPVEGGVAVVRRQGGRLEVNGAPFLGDAVRFRAGEEMADAGVPGHEPLRAADFEVRGDVVVRLFRERLQLVNVIPLEDYLMAVLGSEMPVSFPDEALKAQAVAARTYALHKKLEAYGAPFHLGSSVLHQVYGGMHREDARTRAAVEATRGEVLTHELAPIEAYFHATCGGRTESGADALQRDLPYLQPVDCPCGQLAVSRWTARVSVSEVQAALRQSPGGLHVAARTPTGRVRRVGTERGGGLDAVALRQRLGYGRLKSLAFEVEREGAHFRFSGRGFGHGAGLCQWGAKTLAERGLDYRAILSHYYPGTELQQLY